MEVDKVVQDENQQNAELLDTPPNHNKKETTLDTSTDDSENLHDISHCSVSTEKGFPMACAKTKATPEAVRTRRLVQEHLHMSSPSDSLLSPCTAKLFGKGGKKAVSGPAAALRKKQLTSIPFKLNE
ncbi:unnamed protein product [Auanema sp. JU1783]|nr:unnamed protein product [Auanema sp. JU1783]